MSSGIGSKVINSQSSTIDHDALANFESNEHIDWTSATEDLETTGHVEAGSYIGADTVRALVAPSASEVLTGTGLDDIILDASEYTGPTVELRILTVTAAQPDQFRLYMGDGTNGTILINAQDMSTTPTDIFNGLKVSWGADTGHTAFEYWSVTVAGSELALQNINGDHLLDIENGAIVNGDVFIGKTPEDNSLLLQQTTNNSWEALKSYAVRQLADGTTYINSGLGKAIEFTVGGVRVMRALGGKLGIGVTSMLGKLHVNQESATGAVPVQVLQQTDTDESFVDYRGTSAGDAGSSISTLTAGNSIQGFIKVEINGTTQWMPYYDAPTS